MKRSTSGFTLAEVIVAAAILAIIMVMLLSMTSQTQKLVQGTAGKAAQFRDARAAFDSITRRLSQATLNTHWDYQFRTTEQIIDGRTVKVKVPVRYERAAELRFRSGPMDGLTAGNGPDGARHFTHGVFFNAPNGWVDDVEKLGAMDQLLNTWGYFVELGDDRKLRPAFLEKTVAARRRFRLYEFTEPAESFRVYEKNVQTAGSTDWFAPALAKLPRPARAIAENVIALIILPRLPRADEEQWREQTRSAAAPLLAPGFRYDSTQGVRDATLNTKHQLPPFVQVTMIAIDEVSAAKLAGEFPDHPSQGVDFGGLFEKTENLDDNPRTPAPGDGDIATLEKQLMKLGVSHRIFSTNVAIRGAKWSRSQAD